MRNRREVLKSGFLCSMIPCLSIAECMHQGDEVNVVIVFYLLRIIVGLLRRLPAGDSIRWPSSPRPRVSQVVRLKISRIIASSLAVIECSIRGSFTPSTTVLGEFRWKSSLLMAVPKVLEDFKSYPLTRQFTSICLSVRTSQLNQQNRIVRAQEWGWWYLQNLIRNDLYSSFLRA